jgi:hypothetical protein
VTALLVPVAVVANGLAAGVLLWTAVCGVPLMQMMPPDRYVRVHQFWGKRFEPLQPICVAVTGAVDVALAVFGPAGASRWLFAGAAVLAGAVIAVSATRNVPMKRWVMSLRPEALPEDFAQRDPRKRWGAWNLVRTVLAVAALVLNAAGIGALL